MLYKMSIALHTVFILNENIKWLEEYIIYYLNLGISHFYLYDNEGSIGRNGSNEETNKYGFPAKTTSNEAEQKSLSKIILKYNEYITHILWQPKNSNNQIIYGYNESVQDCIKKYGNLHEWMCFLDLDEFVFSEKNVSLPDYLNSLDENISAVKLLQKKFLDRFLSKEKYITQEFGCINNLDYDKNWGPKNIIRCKDFVNSMGMHNMNTRKKTIVAEVGTLRFNHYNLNDKQFLWMKSFYKVNYSFAINGVDEGMKRYKHLFDL